MSAKVWLYPPQKTQAHIGDVCWQVEAHVVKADAIDKEELDHDEDIKPLYWSFKDEVKARAHAKKTLGRTDLAYGAVQVQKMEVDWLSRKDNVGEWVAAGEVEELAQDDL